MRSFSYCTSTPFASLRPDRVVVERLLADGYTAAAIDAAVALIDSGRTDLIADVIAGEITIERALKLARGR